MSTLLAVPEVDRSPPYQQIADHYREQMRRGEIRVGDVLPANRKLVDEWRVSTHTIQRAMALLREERLIQSRPAKGPLVIALPAPQPPP